MDRSQIRHFSREDVHMVKEHTKGCPPLPVPGEVQLETIESRHSCSAGWLSLRPGNKNKRCQKIVAELESLCLRRCRLRHCCGKLDDCSSNQKPWNGHVTQQLYTWIWTPKNRKQTAEQTFYYMFKAALFSVAKSPGNRSSHQHTVGKQNVVHTHCG